MLQRALEIVSPNASNIDDGMEEAESMIEEPVVNAEPDFVPIGESLNEELSSEDKHTLFEYNQQIQDKIGDMLYVFDHKEHPKAYKDIVKASFLISEAVDDCLGDKDIDESLKKNLKEDVSSDEACNELIDEAYRYLEMAADMFEDGAETYHIDGSLGPAQFIDDVGEITYNLDRISSEVFNAVHGIDESLKESDEDRIKYLKGRLGEIVKAIENGADPERLAVEKNRIMDELHKLGCDDGWFDESLTEDLHDKFKKEIKSAYKQWAAQVEKAEQQRKEATYMIPEGDGTKIH